MTALAPATALYTDAVLTAPAALAAVARALGSRVVGGGTASAHVPLSGGGRATVAVAKFGDEVPVTIDVVGDAVAVADALRAVGWSVRLGLV
ncbi:hypothetical protein HQQ80_13055 [Microbacteriaceae bacterium VKM Ac-2855]|nr:hypothetical protein [Microbacteriaceae bacterium VKM Ac-2855]